MQATAQAQPNIALVKYWGKRDLAANLPAVDSLSITLDALWTRTRVRFDSHLSADEISIDGNASAAESARVSACLDTLRQRAGVTDRAHVESRNNFPRGAGLASSASGFAALVTAAAAALDLSLTGTERSCLARQASGSAARSMFGGFVEMPNVADTSDVCAEPLLAEDEWPLDVLIAVTSRGRKTVGSTAGMELTAGTSPYYHAWVAGSRQDFAAARGAVLSRDFDALAAVAEHSCLKMHGVMLAANPGLVYWNGGTVEAVHRIRELRHDGTPVFFTIDAGPQLKAVCPPEHAATVRAALRDVRGVVDVLHSQLGPGARLVDTGP